MIGAGRVMTSPIAGALGAADGPVWIHIGSLIDGSSPTVAHAAHVVYNEAEILFVGREGKTPPRALVRPGQETPDVEAPLHTLLPCLIEAHAHLYLEGGALDQDARVANRAGTFAERLGAADARVETLATLGIAAVRDGGDKEGIGLALSQRSKTGDMLRGRPYIDSPGAAIHREGRYGSFMSQPMEQFSSAHECVEARVAAGADRIKIIASGIVDFKRASVSGAPQFSSAEISEIVAAAKSCGRQTFAHASGVDGIENAILGGVDSIEHGFFITDEQLARMRDAHIAWVPTFAPVQAQLDHAERLGWDETVRANLRRILDGHAASIRHARELGVLIVAGSDAGSFGVPHGLGLLAELELMEQAGMTPLEVLNAATGVGAARFVYTAPVGKIESGYRSRFMVTYHSPLLSVANVGREGIVVYDGAVHEMGGSDPAGL